MPTQIKILVTHIVIFVVLIASFSEGETYAQTTVHAAITDLVGREPLEREFGAFRDVLSEESGVNIEFFPVMNRTAAVECERHPCHKSRCGKQQSPQKNTATRG